MPPRPHMTIAIPVDPDAERVPAQAAAARGHSHWLLYGYDPPDQP
jgi:hypothetical protein